jgi:hypothetical protein
VRERDVRNNKRKLTLDDLKAFKDSQLNRRRGNYFLWQLSKAKTQSLKCSSYSMAGVLTGHSGDIQNAFIIFFSKKSVLTLRE